MITIPNKQLNSIEISSCNASIREICVFIEDLQKTEINRKDALELIKKSIKAKIYEASKNRINTINAFNNGFNYAEINLK